AGLTVEEKRLWETGRGIVVLLGIAKGDDEATADRMIDKLLKLRILPDGAGRINRSALQEGAAVCVVSNFTLYADCASSRRPDFARAMGFADAEKLYGYFMTKIAEKAAAWAEGGAVCPVHAGVFGGDMLLEIHNDGPLTVILDSAEF
ncbi:MAG: D-aminoacyl-tRNA deacylase, partial [Clostridia bacterium]|nr:D-aminoacyl-tRNA deacylase [Clostridia bacterium]